MNAPVREGEILAGKYRVDRVIGIGGMGVVVAAQHIDLDEKVAIKFLLPDTVANSEAVARFAREARAAVKIKSEHVARVSDVGKLGNGAPYMVMEYLEGSDLSEWLVRRGALPVEEAVEFVLQACEAIAEAHTLGIVHRDLKPANLFVIRGPDGLLSIKVLDFGISKTTGMVGSAPSDSVTKTSALMGSPLYMSPEQMHSSKDVDARTDIWALGVILYELITASPPFTGATVPELVLQVVQAPPLPLREKRPDASEDLEAVILKCLNKDRGKRYETVGELAAALLPFGPKRSKSSVERIARVMNAAGLSGTALALPLSSDRKDEPPGGAGTAASWARTTLGKGRGPWMIVGGIAVVIGVGAAASAWRRKPIEDERPQVGNARLENSSASQRPSKPSQENVISPDPPVASEGEPSLGFAPAGPSSELPDVRPPSVVVGVTNRPSTNPTHSPSIAKPPVVQASATGRAPIPHSSALPLPAPNEPPAPPKSGGPDCTQKCTLDSQGNPHFRPECFKKP